MKIAQTPKFQPITITLETAEEAEAVWAALENRAQDPGGMAILNKLANWFCHQSQLGG